MTLGSMTEKGTVRKLIVEATVGFQIEKVKCLKLADTTKVQ